jgi:integral membrane sensor domain MASE1
MTSKLVASRARRVWLGLISTLFALAATICSTNVSWADEDGISFWIPGLFGSLAAVPQQPGWSVTAITYFTDVSASGNVAVARQIRLGQFNPTIHANISANIHAKFGMMLNMHPHSPNRARC